MPTPGCSAIEEEEEEEEEEDVLKGIVPRVVYVHNYMWLQEDNLVLTFKPNKCCVGTC
jgi:hypothetical protein